MFFKKLLHIPRKNILPPFVAPLLPGCALPLSVTLRVPPLPQGRGFKGSPFGGAPRSGERVFRISFSLPLSVTFRVPPVSPRLGHARGLTPHCGVIQDPRAAPLPQGRGFNFDRSARLWVERMFLAKPRRGGACSSRFVRSMPFVADRRGSRRGSVTLGV
jgi:hypothetical protein